MFTKYWSLFVVLFLLVLTAGLYFLDLQLFHNPKDTFFWFMMSLSFLPVDILLVVIVVNNLFAYREQKAQLAKLNMVIGAFFVEAGRELLEKFEPYNVDSTELKKCLLISNVWTDKSFKDAARTVRALQFKIDSGRGDLCELKALLSGKRDFVLRLLENPNLMEHETFSDLLWAVSHLGEELAARRDLRDLSQKDAEHLAGDIKRAYVLLIVEWLAYMKHLKGNYSYLYSLAVRTNPFDSNSKVEIV